MAFSYDVSSSRGRVRLLVMDRDTENEDNQIFTDAEIDAFLALEENSIYQAAAAAARAIGAESGRCKIAYSVLGSALRVDLKGIPDYFNALADKYEEKALAAPGFDILEVGSLIHPAHGIDETEYDSDNDDQDIYYKQDYRSEGQV